jgi:hypothetical protein
MVVTNQLRNQHLLWRAGFGPKAEQVQFLASMSQKELLKKLVKGSTSARIHQVAKNSFDGIMKGFADAGKIQNLTQEQKQQMQSNRGKLKNLNGVGWKRW